MPCSMSLSAADSVGLGARPFTPARAGVKGNRFTVPCSDGAISGTRLGREGGLRAVRNDFSDGRRPCFLEAEARLPRHSAGTGVFSAPGNGAASWGE